MTRGGSCCPRRRSHLSSSNSSGGGRRSQGQELPCRNERRDTSNHHTKEIIRRSDALTHEEADAAPRGSSLPRACLRGARRPTPSEARHTVPIARALESGDRCQAVS